MRLRHVAALGAAVAGLLAVPVSAGTALASTPAPKPKPVQVVRIACPMIQVVLSGQQPVPSPAPAPPKIRARGKLPLPCCAPFPFPLKVKAVQAGHPKKVKIRRGKGVPVAIVFAGGCRPMTFDMPSGSSVATEVHGPRLAVHQLVFYHGRIYMIASVSGRTFTVDFRGQLFVNNGAAIQDGRAFVMVPPRFLKFPVNPPR